MIFNVFPNLIKLGKGPLDYASFLNIMVVSD